MYLKALLIAQGTAVLGATQFSYTGSCAGTSQPINYWLPDGTNCAILPFNLATAQTIGGVRYTSACCNWFTDGVGQCAYNTRSISQMTDKTTCLDGNAMGSCASVRITHNVDRGVLSPNARTC